MVINVTPPERLGQTRLAGGRRLGWAEWGSPSGTPVLLCSGSATSRWLGLPVDAISGLGVRLITVDRPGLGASSAADGWTLHDWALVVGEFAQARALAGMAAVGFSVGAPFALACAAERVVTGVSLVSATDELACPALAPVLEPEIAMLVKQTAANASGLELLLAGAADADALRDAVVGPSHGADRRVYADPAFDRSYRRALADGFAQGGAGYARETVLALSRWPFDPSTIRVPVDLWYGEQDVNPLHSPDLGTFLTQRMPTARRFVVPNAGSALLWTHTETVLRSLLHRIAPR
ncbi:alpha/beta fold hydrolase [Streptomyces sp. MMS24-I2-30]|uniref:alpha/beta fold hydrolase n=1 Tax=Streptomyces sp. MMS24-I2-30 TaxID=3351564 RepID=UPI003896D512